MNTRVIVLLIALLSPIWWLYLCALIGAETSFFGPRKENTYGFVNILASGLVWVASFFLAYKVWDLLEDWCNHRELLRKAKEQAMLNLLKRGEQ